MGKFLSRPGAAKQLQQALAKARHIGGSPYYAGPVDGILGPASQAAIVAFRRDHDLSPTVEIDNTMLRLLGLGPALITEPGTLGNTIALPIIELVLAQLTKGLPPMLSGYKTYATAAVLAVMALYSIIFGDLPLVGHVDPGSAIMALLGSLGLGFARTGAKTEANKVSGQQ